MPRKPKQSRPYVMRGPARPTKARATVLDKPDTRMPPNPVPKLTADQLKRLQGDDKTDPRLRGVNRWLMRWAVTHGDGEYLPLMARSEPLFASSHDRLPPLDDEESKVVDAVYKSAPDWARKFVKLWYRKGLTAPEMQAELAIKRRQAIYDERSKVLFFFLGRLTGEGLSVNSRADVGDP